MSRFVGGDARRLLQVGGLLGWILACSGPTASVPVVQPVPVPAPPAPPAPAPVASKAPTPTGPLTRGSLSPEVRARLDALGPTMEAVHDAASFEAALQQAIETSDTLTGEIDAFYRNKGCEPAELEAIGVLPGMGLDCGGDGDEGVASLSVDAWQALAARTPEAVDDRFVALTTFAYGSMVPEHFTRWWAPMEDGVCSQLGTGVVLETLEKADAVTAEGPQFAEQVAEIRKGALAEIVAKRWSYCKSEREERDSRDLQEEVRKVLALTTLSPAERAAIEAASKHLHGEPMK